VFLNLGLIAALPQSKKRTSHLEIATFPVMFFEMLQDFYEGVQTQVIGRSYSYVC
jgi:hypothetical protein